ncbi:MULTISPECIES: type II secretion system F family protein [unclassified Luteococcus]|uniref:type II secretion system F family protein n=1 Tax=unclassified Luteococcus TaxID=2639923 RepID=UPI00313C3F71
MISPAIALAAGCAGLAVWLTAGQPVRRLGPRGQGRRLPGWVRGRPGAMRLGLRIRVALVLAAVAVLLLPGVQGMLLAPAVGLVAVVVLGQLEPGAGRRRSARVRAQLPETLELLAATLEAGAPLRTAVAEVASIGPTATAETLASVRSRVEVGLSDADAWRAVAEEAGWGPIARDLARSSDTGSAAAAVLRQHAADVRRARQDAQLARARAVGVRSVLPLMTCFLPAFLLTGVVPIVAGLVGSLTLR